MCLAIPSKIISMNNTTARVDVYGARRDISLLLMSEDVSIGDYVLVHAGFAIQKVDEDAANEAIGLIKKILDNDKIED